MTAEAQFRRLRALFDDAMELADSERDSFAVAQCGDDVALLDSLRRLLDCERDGPVLDPLAAGEALQRTLRDALPRAFVEGRQLGPFRIVEALGGGGMGRVYRAVRSDGVVEQQVAVKFVRDGLVNPLLLERFSAERRALAALQHPNICRFIDTGQLEDGTPYVVMELVDGEPLLAYCDRRQLGVTARLQLLRRIVAAVGHAHRNLIVHRDIKSDNILVTADGEPTLLDFGIAKRLSPNDPDETATAQRFLTPANAAPEQLLGEAVGVGCDVYALGVLAYELLSGRPPFDLAGLTAGQIERMLTSVPPLPMSQRLRDADPAIAGARGVSDTRALARQLAGDLDAIVAHCLRKAADERYPTVDKLDEDLERVLACRPVSVRQGHRRYRLRKFVQRHRVAVCLSLALSLTLIVGGTLLIAQTISLRAEQQLATRERDRAERAVGIMTSAFLAADPARANGAKTTVRDVLMAAHRELEAVYEEQPDLFAVLGRTIASIEDRLGMEQNAANLAAKAAAAAQAAGLPATIEHQLRTLAAIGIAGTGDFDGAHEQLDAADALGVPRTAQWYLASSKVLRYQGAPDAAIDAARFAVDMSGSPEESELHVSALWQLSDVLRAAERHQDALDVIDDALATLTANYAPGHAFIIKTRMRRAQALTAVGRADDAVAESRTLVDEASGTFGANSALSAAASSIEGQALVEAGRLDEAVISLRRAVELWRETFGPEHFNTVRSEFALAEALASLGQEDVEAEALYREAIVQSDRAKRSTHDQSSHFRSRLASLLSRQRRFADALDILVDWPGLDSFGSLDVLNQEELRTELTSAFAAAGCPGRRSSVLVRNCAKAEPIVANGR